jgi:hypothetical protein
MTHELHPPPLHSPPSGQPTDFISRTEKFWVTARRDSTFPSTIVSGLVTKPWILTGQGAWLDPVQSSELECVRTASTATAKSHGCAQVNFLNSLHQPAPIPAWRQRLHLAARLFKQTLDSLLCFQCFPLLDRLCFQAASQGNCGVTLLNHGPIVRPLHCR